MHRHKLGSSTGGTRNSVHMTPQDHRKMTNPGANRATPPVTSRHTVMASSGLGGRPSQSVSASHRRRNSQPTRTTTTIGSMRPTQSQQLPLTRRSADNALAVTANQRVTEWLRSAGSLPEEAETEMDDEATQLQQQKVILLKTLPV